MPRPDPAAEDGGEAMITMPHQAKQLLVDALAEQWSSLAQVLGELTASDWSAPSPLPGWTVHDIVAHLIGTEATLNGQQPPTDPTDYSARPHVRNELGEFNELWVSSMRDHTPEQLRTRFAEVTAARRAALAAMSQEDFDAPSWTPLGPGTYADFMRLRVFDSWMHEQDIRFTVGKPGHDHGTCAELVVDVIVDRLGVLIGKTLDAPQGSSVTLTLTGPVRRQAHVLVEGTANLVHELPCPATATLRLSSTLCTRLVGGRVEPDDHLADIRITGDTDLGTRLVRSFVSTP
ncbi:maleylpyruvate isomerase family mycothiol-dependent enzyme [Amycolatopsis cihanbeyliensis]|nr:maleylpyruvate isomerase family mycothiol-dependent enzyme [Amycolatopsis cihanbeyliensis]